MKVEGNGPLKQKFGNQGTGKWNFEAENWTFSPWDSRRGNI